jgi:hypothetical protein
VVPAITQWQVTRNGPCPAATQATAIWSTQNAVNVTIWIDNPAGSGTTYGPSNPPGGQALQFVCGSAPHTYYVQATASNGTKTNQQQVVVTAS